MEIVNSKDTLLSNYEVYKILKETQTTGQRQRNDTLATIRYETLEYFKNSPCVNQSEEVIQDFLNAIKPYMESLTNEEIVVILNNRPTSIVEISLMVDDDRLSDDALAELLEIVKERLPPPPQQ